MRSSTHRGIVSRSFEYQNNKLFSLCDALDLTKGTFLLFVASICVWLYAEAAEAQQKPDLTIPVTIWQDESAIAYQASKFSVARNSNPTQQPVAQRAVLAREKKSLKRIKANREVRRTAKFTEVEILLSDEFSIGYISTLSRAPGSDLEVLDGPKRIRVQLPTSRVEALVDDGAEITVLRKFILVEGSTDKAASLNSDVAVLETCSGDYCYGSNSDNEDIPDDGYDRNEWAWSDIPISCALPGTPVTCIDVHFEIIHTYVGDLIVVLSDYDVTDVYVLWQFEGGGTDNINKTVTGITTFNGKMVNQIWTLWAADDAALDSGYINYWWIKVYYGCEPPDNDDCLDAIAVTESVAYLGSSVCATGGYESSCGINDTADVWHKFTASSSGNYTISLRDSGFDTTLVVFDYCGGPELVCNDDIFYPSNVQSEVAIDLTGGNTYYIRVAGYDGETGSYKLVVEPCPAPDNDDCLDAIPVAEGVPYDADTNCATGVYESSCSLNDTADVWHSYTPPTAGQVTISLSGSAFDTTLAVFDYCGGTELACNDDIDFQGGNYQSEITMNMTSAQTYLIRIAGYDGATGDYTLTVTRISCVEPNEPNSPSPANGANDLSVCTVLSWNGSWTSALQANNKAAISSSKGPIIPTVIYGPDDRLDEYEVNDLNILAVGDSMVALIYQSNLIDNGDGTFSLPVETYAEWYLRTDPIGTGNPLCSDEPFRNQPVPAFCSGFLVAPDIIATAGHCAEDCPNMAAVFGFVMLDANTPVLTIDGSEIYYCSEVIEQAHGSDWALIRLDREVAGHSPLSVRVAGVVPDGQPLLVIGHPVGLPRKYAGGATVRSNNPLSPYFQANVDTYVGNSGSPVFNADTLEVEGILVRGNVDWEPNGLCDSSNRCPDSGCPGWEDVTRTTEFAFSWVSYDVYFDVNSPPVELIYSDIDVPMCDPTTEPNATLMPYTTYYWQVVAKNCCGETPGNAWSFTTGPPPAVGDFEPDCDVDMDDLEVLCDQWLLEKLSADLAPIEGGSFVDFLDWAVFANAWQSTPSSPNWNPKCDIAPEEGDDIVDLNDLAVFVDQWLQFGAYCADIAPAPEGDGVVNLLDFAVFAENWLESTNP